MPVKAERLAPVIDDDELAVAGKRIGKGDAPVVDDAYGRTDDGRNLDAVGRAARGCGVLAEAMPQGAGRWPLELASRCGERKAGRSRGGAGRRRGQLAQR